ncbi:MAG TPA: hypothetical protein PKJ97_02120 [Candidatus Bilamarchaeaceae archaeon]|nr:hypothetical protein [Candidatus Bilamarchaeaceae archaeon]
MRTRFAIPAKPSEMGGPRFERLMGTKVPYEQRERVDRFILGIPAGIARRIALRVLDESRSGRPEGVSDREYFEALLKSPALARFVDSGILARIAKMDLPVQANALRVAMQRCSEESGGYSSLEFHKNLLMDERENVAGEKEAAILETVRRSGAGREAVESFSRWLEGQDAHAVNLLYYMDVAERVLRIAGKTGIAGAEDHALRETIPKEIEMIRESNSGCIGMEPYAVDSLMHGLGDSIRIRMAGAGI